MLVLNKKAGEAWATRSANRIQNYIDRRTAELLAQGKSKDEAKALTDAEVLQGKAFQ